LFNRRANGPPLNPGGDTATLLAAMRASSRRNGCSVRGHELVASADDDRAIASTVVSVFRA